MTKMKKVVSYVLVFLTVFSSFTILPSEFWGWANVSATDVTTEKSNATKTYTEGDFIYSIIDEDEVKIEDVSSIGRSNPKLVIPDVTIGYQYPELANKKVTDIGNNVAEGYWWLAYVKLGKYVKSIGNYAFSINDSWRKIDIDMSSCTGLTTVCVGAFTSREVYTIYCVKDSITYNTLQRYGYTEQIKTKPEEKIYTEGDYKYSIINENEVKIVDYIGMDMEIDIPDVTTGSECPELANKKVTAIGDYAFAGEYLFTVTGGKNIVSIGKSAFRQRESTDSVIGLSEVDLSESTGLTTIDVTAFAYNNRLSTLILPDSLETIGSCAFYYCNDFTTLEIGNNIKSIGIDAFAWCKNLKTINIKGGNNATIDLGAFRFCYNLTDVAIGDGVKTIGDVAFEDTNIANLSLGNTIESIGERAVEGNRITELTIPDSVKTIGASAFAYSTYLTNLTIGSGCTFIGSDAFRGCKSLENIIVSEENTTYKSDDGVLFNKDMTEILLYPNARGGAYIIPDAVTIIGNDVFRWCENMTEVVIGDNVTKIGDYAFDYCEKLSKVTYGKGINYIGKMAFSHNYILKEVDLSPCTDLKTISKWAFSYNFELTTVILPNSIETIDEDAFSYCYELTTVEILGKELTQIEEDGLPNNDTCTIYCYKNSTTHNTLKNNGYTNIKFFTSDVHLTDITVNGTSVDSFNTETKDYTVYLDNTTDVSIVPVFEEENVTYTVTAENNVHTITVFDENDEVIDKYKVTVNEHNYTVTGDVTLMLNNISATKVGGNIALPAGTYKLKIAKGEKLFGYNKVVADYCNGLTLNPKFTSYITLNATGGTYTFQFDIVTNKLVIKYDSNLPKEYLIGDIDTILKPVENKPLSIGTQQLPAGTYKFKLSIGGKEYGYNKVVDNATTGSLSVNSKYSSYITLNVTGGIYTFTLNTETNKLTIRHTPIADECTTDVHISGDFNLVLNDKLTTGEDLTTATGTETLEPGIYTFKVYNYGVVYTSGIVINDVAAKNLSSKYTTPVTLNATGGTYQFTFDKVTGALEVIMLG